MESKQLSQRGLEGVFGAPNRVLETSWTLFQGPKWDLEKFLALKKDLRCMPSVRVIVFWILLEAPTRPESNNNPVQMMLR